MDSIDEKIHQIIFNAAADFDSDEDIQPIAEITRPKFDARSYLSRTRNGTGLL